MTGKEVERSNGQLIRLNNNHRQELKANPQDSQEGSPPALSMDPEVLRRLSYTPKGEDPAFWPVRVFTELKYYISVKDEAPNPDARTVGNKYAPFQESIDRLSTAYSIVAHRHCEQEGWKEQIEANLERDRQTYGRDQVTLTDPEFQFLNQITTARRIPLDTQKRVYSHSEVPIASHIDPYGRRHLTTEEIREYLQHSKDEEGK